MTDRELLELAAKAAGREWLSYHHTKGLCCRDESYGGLIEYYWNPLTDDGDALRLAVKLELLVDMHGMHARVCFPYESPLVCEPMTEDRSAATRRAIVRAAAEIGRTE